MIDRYIIHDDAIHLFCKCHKCMRNQEIHDRCVIHKIDDSNIIMMLIIIIIMMNDKIDMMIMMITMLNEVIFHEHHNHHHLIIDNLGTLMKSVLVFLLFYSHLIIITLNLLDLHL